MTTNQAPSYYNTTHQSGRVLDDYREKASTQDEIVLSFFRKNPNLSFTPFEVQNGGIFNKNTPLTSVRRSITNLEKRGLLEKTPEQRSGEYGRANYCWKLYVPKEPRQFEQAKLF